MFWILLAAGFGLYGLYIGVMILVYLLLPHARGILAPVAYILVHGLIYFPIPFLFALGEARPARREIVLWLLCASGPALLAGLARGGFLAYTGANPAFARLVLFLLQVVFPLGLGLWVTVFLILRWRRAFPNGLAELGLAHQERPLLFGQIGIGIGAALLVFVHLLLTLFYSGLGLPSWAGLEVLWRAGFLTLAQETLGEELFYRGFFFQYLRRSNWAFWPAALLVSVFDAAHFLFVPGTLDNLTRTVGFVYYVFIYSMVNCMLIDRTKSLVAPWVANALFTMIFRVFPV